MLFHPGRTRGTCRALSLPRSSLLTQPATWRRPVALTVLREPRRRVGVAAGGTGVDARKGEARDAAAGDWGPPSVGAARLSALWTAFRSACGGSDASGLSLIHISEPTRPY